MGKTATVMGKWCLLGRYVKTEVTVPVKVLLIGKRVLAYVIKLR